LDIASLNSASAVSSASASMADAMPADLSAAAAAAPQHVYENSWFKVDDFNWLRQQHSPNWAVLPETERVAQVKID